MRILMLTPYLPYPLLSGGQIRTYNLLKKLASKHEVTLFALIKHHSETQHIAELEQYCSEVRVFKRSEKPFTIKNIIKTGISSYPFLVIRNHVRDVTNAVESWINAHHPDLIHAETFYMMPHIPDTSIPIILVEQTIEHLGYESYVQKAPALLRPILNLDVRKIKYWEEYYWKNSTRLVVMSQDDKRYIADTIGEEKKIEVVENGVDTEWFHEVSREEPEIPTVLSVGTFKWLPNIEAVEYLVESIWPLVVAEIPTVRLKIVGNEPTKKVLNYQENDQTIHVLGRVPDIRHAFATAHVLVAPVLSGKGTRYKVLEAMASGTPVVATPTAVEGLNVTHGTHCLIGSTPEELAAHIADLLKNARRRTALAKAGKEFVSTHYDWKLISAKLDEIYKNV